MKTFQKLLLSLAITLLFSPAIAHADGYGPRSSDPHPLSREQHVRLVAALRRIDAAVAPWFGLAFAGRGERLGGSVEHTIRGDAFGLDKESLIRGLEHLDVSGTPRQTAFGLAAVYAAVGRETHRPSIERRGMEMRLVAADLPDDPELRLHGVAARDAVHAFELARGDWSARFPRPAAEGQGLPAAHASGVAAHVSGSLRRQRSRSPFSRPSSVNWSRRTR
jgi:hypothetical protein